MKACKVAVIGMGALLAAGDAPAGKVSMPRKGSYELVFCVVDQAKSLTGGEKFFVSHYEGISMIRTEPPGKPFDRTCHPVKRAVALGAVEIRDPLVKGIPHQAVELSLPQRPLHLAAVAAGAEPEPAQP